MKRLLAVLSCLPLAACPEAPPEYTPQVPQTLKERKVTFNTKITIGGKDEARDASFVMLEVPAGKFMMGSPRNEVGRDDDESGWKETEVNSFWLGKFEVTWDEYICFFQNFESDGDAESWPSLPFEPPDRGMGREGYAAMSIQRHQDENYCKWLSKLTGWKLRVPTDAEWEYACRAGGTIPRPGGIDDYGWSKANSGNGPKKTPKNQKVGAKKPNAWGFHDMLGGVWEYTQADYPDGGGPVLRGGSWNDAPESFRAANRQKVKHIWNKRDPNRPRGVSWLTDGPFVGFRLAADGPPPGE